MEERKGDPSLLLLLLLAFEVVAVLLEGFRRLLLTAGAAVDLAVVAVASSSPVFCFKTYERKDRKLTVMNSTICENLDTPEVIDQKYFWPQVDQLE